MTTFALRLPDRRKRIALWFTIQGIKRVFKEIATLDCSTLLGETRPESAIIAKGGVDFGEETLDMDKLLALGGSLTVSMLQPFGSTVLTDTFKTLARRSTFLTSGMTKTSVSTNVVSTTLLGSVGDDVDVFIGSETVRAHINSATALTSLVRGKYGSRAQRHYVDARHGSAVFLAAPAWVGRRISLYGSFLKDDGTTTAALTQQLGTYSIEEPPKVEENRWTIQCGPLMDEYAKRKCYVGMKPQKGGVIYFASPTDVDMTVQVEDASKFTVGASFLTIALVTVKGDPSAPFGGGKRANRIISGTVTGIDGSATPQVITIRSGADLYSPTVGLQEISDASDGANGGLAVDGVQHVAVLGGGSGADLITAMVSDLGDATNGSRDILPGRERSAPGDDRWRMGAAIDASDIDTTGFDVLSRQWKYVLDAEVTVGALLREWMKLADRFAVVTAAGTLTTKVLSDVADASSLTIDSTVKLTTPPAKTWVEENEIAPTLTVRGNYSPIQKDFTFESNSIDAEMMERYEQRDGVDDGRSIDLKGLGVDVSPHFEEWPQHMVRISPMSQEELATVARRWQLAEGRARLLCSCSCSLKALGVAIGDVVTIGFEASDHAGGSVNGRTARVVGRRPRIDAGAVDLTLALMYTVVKFVPSAVVTAVSTTTLTADTVTLSTTSPDASSTSPENDFPVGVQVRLWHPATGANQVLTVAAIIAGHKLRFTAGIAGGAAAVETSRDWLTWNTLATNAGLTSTSGFTEGGGAYMMPDSETAAAGETRRWR